MEVEEFIRRLNILADLCDKTLNEDTIGMYDKMLSAECDYSSLCYAVEKIIGTRRGRDSFPSVSEILAVVRPEMSDKSLANITASKIIATVGKKGYTWNWPGGHSGDFRAEVEAEVGPLGWVVVQHLGGWTATHTFVNENDETTVRAQVRELALAVKDKEVVTEQHEKLEMSRDVAGLLGDALKELP